MVLSKNEVINDFSKTLIGSFSPKTDLGKFFNSRSNIGLSRKRTEMRYVIKWEYAVIPLTTDKSDKNLLDKYGLEGWELVSVAQAGLEVIAHFKREKK